MKPSELLHIWKCSPRLAGDTLSGGSNVADLRLGGYIFPTQEGSVLTEKGHHTVQYLIASLDRAGFKTSLSGEGASQDREIPPFNVIVRMIKRITYKPNSVLDEPWAYLEPTGETQEAYINEGLTVTIQTPTRLLECSLDCFEVVSDIAPPADSLTNPPRIT